ncbi:glutathione S-transferase PM239X14 [Aspergillus lentulus]|nr:glutathione S-transferase PM239X14 [Aspergillus lentulus]
MEWLWVESRTSSREVVARQTGKSASQGHGLKSRYDRVEENPPIRLPAFAAFVLRSDGQRFDRFVPEMKNGAARVTHLELRQSTTRMRFERLITLCNGLRSFKYYYKPGPFIFERTVTIIAHLQARRDTLETLSGLGFLLTAARI